MLCHSALYYQDSIVLRDGLRIIRRERFFMPGKPSPDEISKASTRSATLSSWAHFEILILKAI